MSRFVCVCASVVYARVCVDGVVGVWVCGWVGVQACVHVCLGVLVCVWVCVQYADKCTERCADRWAGGQVEMYRLPPDWSWRLLCC